MPDELDLNEPTGNEIPDEDLDLEEETETLTEPITYKGVDITVMPAGYEDDEDEGGELFEAGEEDEFIPVDSVISATDSIDVTLDSESAIVTDEGFVKFPQVIIAKSMVQEYATDDGKTVKVFKSAEALKAILGHGENRPVTDEHPPEKIVTKPSQVRGNLENLTFTDDGLLKADVVITCSILSDAVKAGNKNDVSIGFHTHQLKQTGVFNDASYDFVQTDIFLDHLAITKVGRCSAKDGCGFTPQVKKAHIVIKQKDSVPVAKATPVTKPTLSSDQQQVVDTANKIIDTHRVDVIANIVAKKPTVSRDVLDSMSYEALQEMNNALSTDHDAISLGSLSHDSKTSPDIVDNAYAQIT